LADAVHPVDCLVLHRRVPPEVCQYHVVRVGEVQSLSSGLLGGQQHLHFFVVFEVLDGFLPLVFGAAAVDLRPLETIDPLQRLTQMIQE